MWSGVSSLHLDAQISNTRYKLHLARLVDVYLGNAKKFNDTHIGDRIFAGEKYQRVVGQRYADRLQPQMEKSKLQKRELGWNSRSYIYHSLEESQEQHKAVSGTSRASNQEVSRSNDCFQTLRPSSSSQTATQRHRHLEIDMDGSANMSEQDLILNGKYRLNSHHRRRYDDFVNTLAEFDPHDMVKVVEDALNEACERTLLDAYGGTVLPDQHSDPDSDEV